MDFNSIDWNALWQAETARSGLHKSSPKDLWDRRAESFSRRINRVMNGQEGLDKDDYIYKMLSLIEVEPAWTVLDIGCGPGTLTIPLARKVKKVTALDVSEEMLKHLRANAAANGLTNIDYLASSWQEAFSGRLVGAHDVVVASRSLMSGDMQEALKYIDSITRQAAYLTFPVVHLPFDWEIYRVIGRDSKKHAPYIYIYNLLYRLGILANVEILYSKVKVQFATIAAAIDDLQWRTEPFTAAEKATLTAYLETEFAKQKDAPVFTHEGYSQWVLIWWRKHP
jgi:predicted TPR repeat methyltransferase